MNKILALAASMALLTVTSISANEIGTVDHIAPQAINPATAAAMRLANGLSDKRSGPSDSGI